MAYASLLRPQQRHRQIPELTCDLYSSMIFTKTSVRQLESDVGCVLIEDSMVTRRHGLGVYTTLVLCGAVT